MLARSPAGAICSHQGAVLTAALLLLPVGSKARRCHAVSAVVLQAMQCHGCHIAVGATGAAELQELWVVQGQTPAASHPLQPGSSCPSLPAVDAHMTLFSKRFRCETHLFWDTLLALW